MECEVEDIYKIPNFESFICKILNTYVQEENLDEKNKIDYDKVKPVLFEFSKYTYLKTGETLGKCLRLDK